MHLDVQQNLDEQILDVIQPYLDVARHFLVHLRDVVVGVEPLHQLKRDCFLDVELVRKALALLMPMPWPNNSWATRFTSIP